MKNKDGVGKVMNICRIVCDCGYMSNVYHRPDLLINPTCPKCSKPAKLKPEMSCFKFPKRCENEPVVKSIEELEEWMD